MALWNHIERLTGGSEKLKDLLLGFLSDKNDFLKNLTNRIESSR